jgi:hypothetical protein
MNHIDLTEYTVNTGTGTDIEVIDIARAAYNELPNVADWTTKTDGRTVLAHDNGETLTIDLVTLEGKITDWSATTEDEDGDIYDQDGGPVRTIDDLDTLTAYIAAWAE